jgi:outer membrane protein
MRYFAIKIAAMFSISMLFAPMSHSSNIEEPRPKDNHFNFPQFSSTEVSSNGLSIVIKSCNDVSKSTALNLVQIIKYAICNSPKLVISKADIKEKVAALEETKAAYYPSINTSLETSKPSNGDLQYASHTTVSEHLLVTWRLYDFGARAAAVEVAETEVEHAKALLDSDNAELLLSLFDSYYDVENNELQKIANEENQNIAKLTHDLVMRRSDGGVVAKIDTLKSELLKQKLAIEIERTNGELAKSEIRLRNLAAIDNDSNITFATSAFTLWDKNIELWEKIDTNAASKRGTHPAIRAAEVEVENAQRRVDLAKHENRPTVDFSADYYHTKDKGYAFTTNRALSNSIGVSFNFPLFDGFAHRSRVSAAIAQLEKRTEMARTVKQTVRSDILQQIADIKSLEEIVLHCRVAKALAKDAYASSSRRYRSGFADIEEILNSQQLVFDSNLAFKKAISDLQRSRIKLLLMQGLISISFS